MKGVTLAPVTSNAALETHSALRRTGTDIHYEEERMVMLVLGRRGAQSL